jgi:hypothetical protein
MVVAEVIIYPRVHDAVAYNQIDWRKYHLCHRDAPALDGRGEGF